MRRAGERELGALVVREARRAHHVGDPGLGGGPQHGEDSPAAWLKSIATSQPASAALMSSRSGTPGASSLPELRMAGRLERGGEPQRRLARERRAHALAHAAAGADDEHPARRSHQMSPCSFSATCSRSRFACAEPRERQADLVADPALERERGLHRESDWSRRRAP